MSNNHILIRWKESLDIRPLMAKTYQKNKYVSIHCNIRVEPRHDFANTFNFVMHLKVSPRKKIRLKMNPSCLSFQLPNSEVGTCYVTFSYTIHLIISVINSFFPVKQEQLLSCLFCKILWRFRCFSQIYFAK